MKKMFQIPSCTQSFVRMATRSLGAALVATVAGPLAVHAQLIYTGGIGEIEFSGQPVAIYGGGPPTWAFDGFTGLNDILSSPGGGFNAVNYVNPNIAGTGVVPLGAGIFAALAPGVYGGVPFGGGTINLGPTIVQGSVGEVAPGFVSVDLAAESSSFTVGALGMPATIGTFLSISGVLNPNSAIGASLVTYVDDITTAQSVVLAEVLGATGINSGNTVALSGTLGAPAAINAWLAYGPLNATYTGLSSAAVANFLNPGDNVQITSVLTMAADPDATIQFDYLPNDLGGVVLPDGLLFETPEPGTLSLLGAGLSALFIVRKRSRA
jgi:hypothetical protein